MILTTLHRWILHALLLSLSTDSVYFHRQLCTKSLLCLDLIQPTQPHWMQNHMEEIILLRLGMPQKMPLHPLHSWMQGDISPERDAQQYISQFWYILLCHHYWKRAPIQNFLKRKDKIICYDHWNTFGIDGLHNPRAVDFITHGTKAELARFHKFNIGQFPGDSVWKTLIDSHVIILITPVPDQGGSHPSVHVARKKRKKLSLRDALPPNIPVRPAWGSDGCFWEGNIPPTNKDTFCSVCIA